jgi:hypothetical protein
MTEKLPRRRYWYDCEFVEDGVTIKLLSIGVVCEDGREFYAVNSQPGVMHLAAQREWLRDNVMPFLPVKLKSPETAERLISPPSRQWEWDKTHPDFPRVRAHAEIARELLAFLAPEECEPELWAYYGSYDHVAYAQLFGSMVNLPPGLPQVTHELVQRWEDVGRPPTPVQESGQHDALADARWNVELWRVCEEARLRG